MLFSYEDEDIGRFSNLHQFTFKTTSGRRLLKEHFFKVHVSPCYPQVLIICMDCALKLINVIPCFGHCGLKRQMYKEVFSQFQRIIPTSFTMFSVINYIVLFFLHFKFIFWLQKGVKDIKQYLCNLKLFSRSSKNIISVMDFYCHFLL